MRVRAAPRHAWTEWSRNSVSSMGFGPSGSSPNRCSSCEPRAQHVSCGGVVTRRTYVQSRRDKHPFVAANGRLNALQLRQELSKPAARAYGETSVTDQPQSLGPPALHRVQLQAIHKVRPRLGALLRHPDPTQRPRRHPVHTHRPRKVGGHHRHDAGVLENRNDERARAARRRRGRPPPQAGGQPAGGCLMHGAALQTACAATAEKSHLWLSGRHDLVPQRLLHEAGLPWSGKPTGGQGRHIHAPALCITPCSKAR
jgi:hypothetical protein